MTSIEDDVLYREPGDREIVGYVVDFWKLHPDEWARLNDVDNTHEYRSWLYDQVNAATDGELGRLIERVSLHWIWLVGVAVTVTGQLEAGGQL